RPVAHRAEHRGRRRRNGGLSRHAPDTDGSPAAGASGGCVEGAYRLRPLPRVEPAQPQGPRQGGAGRTHSDDRAEPGPAGQAGADDRAHHSVRACPLARMDRPRPAAVQRPAHLRTVAQEWRHAAAPRRGPERPDLPILFARRHPGEVRPGLRGDEPGLGWAARRGQILRHAWSNYLQPLRVLAPAKPEVSMATAHTFPVVRTDEEWRKRLTPEQYVVMRRHGTEMPNSCALLHEKRAGAFECAGCD